MAALILASTSRYRRALLERLQLAFDCEAPGTEERRHDGEPVADMCARLAREKASAVAARHADAWVIGSD